MSPQEQAILERLGVTNFDAAYYLLFDQAGHLDYDWLRTFPQYADDGGPWGFPSVSTILKEVLGLNGDGSPAAPRYSMCEMSYLRRFIGEPGHDTAAALIQAMGSRFAAIGGGLVSPDNLVSHGEAFIRTYLAGQQWLAAAFPELLPLGVAWLPDDFGHDPELPATLRALGLASAAFERVPGAAPLAVRPDVVEAMYRQGVDFRWRASDGSTVLAHFLQGGYGQGAGDSPSVQDCIDSYSRWSLPGQTTPSYPEPFGARTPYLYVPNDNDFSNPDLYLQQTLDGWNAQGGQVYAVQGSFADFVALVEAHAAAQPNDPLDTVAFDGRPYWTGFYATRPDLKSMHHGAARLLLAAESVGLLAAPGGGLPNGFAASVSAAWDAYAPSTHHDFITGTASQDVYGGEQVGLLQTAMDDGQGLVQTALGALAATVAASPGEGETAMVVVNALGTGVDALAELPAPVPAGVQGIRWGSRTAAVQASYEGGLLLRAQALPLGWSTGYLTPVGGAEPDPAWITDDGNGTYQLQNGRVTAVVSETVQWGIDALFDEATGTQLLGGTGNWPAVFTDGANPYLFGYESETFGPFASQALDLVTSGPGLGATVLESGPLRVRLRTVTQVTVGTAAPMLLTREYSLAAGEPFLRMTTTGAAPAAEGAVGYSVMTGFSFAAQPDTLVHGTPNYWTARQGQDMGWGAPVFLPTHRFVIPTRGGTPVAAVYHGEVPAWAVDAGGNLLGCLFRNPPGGPAGTPWSDTGTHTLRYAVRVPSGLAGPESAQPLRESLAYASAPLAAIVPASSSGALPEVRSLADVVAGPGVILAAKPGDVSPGSMVLRLYQPTNDAAEVTVQLALEPASVVQVTALENPLPDAAAARVSGSTFTLPMPYALATVQIVD